MWSQVWQAQAYGKEICQLEGHSKASSVSVADQLEAELQKFDASCRWEGNQRTQ